MKERRRKKNRQGTGKNERRGIEKREGKKGRKSRR